LQAIGCGIADHLAGEGVSSVGVRMAMITNADRHCLGPVLIRLAHLHKAYGEGIRSEDSERALSRLNSLLKRKDVPPILDGLLADTVLDIELLTGRRKLYKEELKAEEDLAAFFGFSPKQVRKQINRICSQRPDPRALAAVQLQTAADLDTLIGHLHSHLKSVDSDRPSGRKQARGHRRKLEQDVEDAIFCIGTVVANGLHTAHFRLSYSISVATYRRVVPSDD
jgi:hypothetical protein